MCVSEFLRIGIFWTLNGTLTNASDLAYNGIFVGGNFGFTSDSSSLALVLAILLYDSFIKLDHKHVRIDHVAVGN